jgi:hypothetical protein
MYRFGADRFFGDWLEFADQLNVRPRKLGSPRDGVQRAPSRHDDRTSRLARSPRRKQPSARWCDRVQQQASAYLLELNSSWTNPADNQRNIAWTRDAWTDLRQRFSSGGVYLNMDSYNEDGEPLIHSTFGTNYERLQEIKKKYDPDNFFRLNMNIVPSWAANVQASTYVRTDPRSQFRVPGLGVCRPRFAVPRSAFALQLEALDCWRCHPWPGIRASIRRAPLGRSSLLATSVPDAACRPGPGCVLAPIWKRPPRGVPCPGSEGRGRQTRFWSSAQDPL